MTATDFDALAAARDIEATGLERAQAEAIAGAMRQAAAADRDELATKADLANLRASFYRALWIQTGSIVGTIVGAIVAAVVALVQLLS